MIKEFEKRLITSLILIPISIFFIIKGSIFFIFFLSILLLATIYEWVMMSKKNNFLKFLGIIFLLFSFYTAFEFRFNENYKDFLFIVTICILTDIGGYIFGKIIKGKKLTKISPNKTYAGMFGAYLTSLLFSTIFFDNYFIFYKLISIIIISSTISQIGDIFISYLKRKNNFKDTGKLLPGHGGLLDRFDGIFFTIIIGSTLKYIL